MRKLIIIGAGGHGRVIADAASLCGYEDIAFLDDAAANAVGKVASFPQYIHEADFIVAIGNNAIRKRICEEIIAVGGQLASVIHPAATVAKGVTIGRGVAVMAGAVINVGAVIGDGVIVNTCSSIDHDCVIDGYVHVSVGARLAGTVCIGERTFVGAGSMVINNTNVCADCMIGAGAVVVKDITVAGTYVGVPARSVK